jgi:hypothetical protein
MKTRLFLMAMALLVSNNTMANFCENFEGWWILESKENQKRVDLEIDCDKQSQKITLKSIEGDADTIKSIRNMEVLLNRAIGVKSQLEVSEKDGSYTQIQKVRVKSSNVLEIISELENSMGQTIDYATWHTTLTFSPDDFDINYETLVIESCKWDDKVSPCEQSFEFRQIVHSL